MEFTRRRVVAGSVGALAVAWGFGTYLSRDALTVTDQYALLDEDASPPTVDLGCIVANDSATRCAATAHLALDLADGETRTATQEVRPFGGNADQAYIALQFRNRTVDELADATARFWLSDCRRLEVVPPVPVGCADSVTREPVER